MQTLFQEIVWVEFVGKFYSFNSIQGIAKRLFILFVKRSNFGLFEVFSNFNEKALWILVIIRGGPNLTDFHHVSKKLVIRCLGCGLQLSNGMAVIYAVFPLNHILYWVAIVRIWGWNFVVDF